MDGVDGPVRRKRTADERLDHEAALEADRRIAADRAREREQYIDSVYPRLLPEDRPIRVRLDPSTFAVDLLSPPAELPEVALGCDALPLVVPPIGDDANVRLGEFDAAYVDELNKQSWGYRDGTTAIIVGSGTASRGVMDPYFFSAGGGFAVVRGGQRTPATTASPKLVFPFPDWREGATWMAGTLSCSAALMSVEFAATFDIGKRLLAPTDLANELRGTDAHHAQYVDLRLFVRFADDGAGGRAVAEAAAEAVGFPVPLPPISQANVRLDRDEGDVRRTFGASAKLTPMFTGVPVGAFMSALARLRATAPPPLRWFCVMVSDPKVNIGMPLLDNANDVILARGLARGVPQRAEDGGAAAASARYLDASTLISQGYPDAVDPLVVVRDAASPTTYGIVRDLQDPAVGGVDARDCDAWLNTRGDRGLYGLCGPLLSSAQEDPPPAWRRALATLIAMRVLSLERDGGRVVPGGDGVSDAKDMLEAYRAISAGPRASDVVLRDLHFFLFVSIVKAGILNAVASRR